jgi:hypothetical protein
VLFLSRLKTPLLQSILSKTRINQIFNKYSTGDEQPGTANTTTMTSSASMSTFKPVDESSNLISTAQSMESLVKAVIMPVSGNLIHQVDAQRSNNYEVVTLATHSANDVSGKVGLTELSELAIDQHSSSSSASSSGTSSDSSPASPVSIDSSDDTTTATSTNNTHSNKHEQQVQLII